MALCTSIPLLLFAMHAEIDYMHKLSSWITKFKSWIASQMAAWLSMRSRERGEIGNYPTNGVQNLSHGSHHRLQHGGV
eukprot:1159321-Pelagomonas_calceolata.AAC.6